MGRRVRRSNRQTKQDFTTAGGDADALDQLRACMGDDAADSTLRRLYLAASVEGLTLQQTCDHIATARAQAWQHESFAAIYTRLIRETP